MQNLSDHVIFPIIIPQQLSSTCRIKAKLLLITFGRHTRSCMLWFLHTCPATPNFLSKLRILLTLKFAASSWALCAWYSFWTNTSFLFLFSLRKLLSFFQSPSKYHPFKDVSSLSTSPHHCTIILFLYHCMLSLFLALYFSHSIIFLVYSLFLFITWLSQRQRLCLI